MNPGQHPLLIPILLLGGALASAALPPAWRRLRLGVAGLAVLLALGVAVDLIPLAAGGALLPSFGQVVPGVPLTLRADLTGLVLVLMTSVAALLALAAPGRRPGEEAAILVTAAGAAVAALAGNAVVLFAGLEVANLGGMLLARAASGRLSRGAVVAFAIQHAFALGMLAAAVELIVATGTSDPLAVPPSALGVGIAVPWGLAGASRLLAAMWWPGPAGGRATRAALAVGSVPAGGAVLLRLIAGLSGSPPLTLTVTLGAVGAAAAAGGAALAWRWRSDPQRSGRALLVAAAAPVVALAGVPGGSGGAAAGLLALELAVLAAPAWSQGVGRGPIARGLAAAALLAAGGLPLGFGSAALVIELGDLARLGRAGAPLLMALGAAASVAALAALASCRHALGRADSGSSGRRLRPDAALALAAGALAALLPGGAAELVLGPLAGAGAVGAPDLATVSGAGGAWPGGYLTLALLAALAAFVCAAALLGRPLPRPLPAPAGPQPRPLWRPLLRSRHAVGPAWRRLGAALDVVDAWLETQPGLVFAVAAAFAAILLFR